jgi:mannose-1-phosphate guanylyltransferase
LKAILLAAGLGTRLRPLTNQTPKCLLPIDGKPLLGHWLDILSKVGVGPVLINTHHLAERVKMFVDDREKDSDVKLVFEGELLGTGGTLKKNVDFIGGNPLLVIHADNFCLSNIKALLQAHQNRTQEVEITMMTFVANDPTQCGVVELDKNQIVTGFYEKVDVPPSNIANAAVYVFEPTVINDIVSNTKEYLDISRDVLPNYLGRMLAWAADGFHIDIGTSDNLAEANLFMSTNRP